MRIQRRRLRRRQLAGQRLEPRPCAVKAEIIEVDMPPAAAGLIDETDKDLAAFDRLQINNHWPQILFVLTRRAVEHLVVVRSNDIDPRLPTAAAADKKTGPRMRYLKRFA